MDDEMEDIIEDECSSSSSSSSDETSSEFDSDYEYDAARFFDFTKPETSSEADEAEEWFRYAPTCPPSPFVVKLNLAKILSMSDPSKSPKLEHSKSMNSAGTSGSQKSGTKSTTKPAKARSSTLMQPTASLLAKQNKPQDANPPTRSSQRLRSPSLKLGEKSSRSLSGLEDLGTKRQKLESGFVRKLSQVKDQILLSPKISKKGKSMGGIPVQSKLKVTIPKEPLLGTSLRAADRVRSKNSESTEQPKLKSNSFKALPLNRKILLSPTTLPRQKSAPKMPDFQVFNSKTKERALQHSSSNVSDKQIDDSVTQSRAAQLRRSYSEKASNNEKIATSPKYSSRTPLNKKNLTIEKRMGIDQNIRQEPTKSPRTKKADRNSSNPPVELFSKLSIKSCETNKVSQTKVNQYTKGSKENAPDRMQLEFLRCMGKSNQCGGSNNFHANMSRSLDIR